MKSFDISPFLVLRKHLKIVHHIPGRVRLRVGATLFKELEGVDSSLFDQVLGEIEGIHDVRINPAAASVVINYSPTKLQPDWWNTLIDGEEGKAADMLHRLIASELSQAVEMVREH